MLIKALLVGLWAWFNGGQWVEYLGWFVNGAPILSGTITGLLLGDIKSGIIVGATIQLLYMGQVTVGGISSYDKCYAGIIGTAVTIVSHQSPKVGLTIAVSLGTLGLIASNAKMTFDAIFVHMADKYAEKGETKLIWIYNWLLPVLTSIIWYGIPAFLSVYFGATYFEGLMNSLPKFILNALNAVGTVLPALGIAMLLKQVYNGKFVGFAIIGYVCVAYLKFNIIAVTLVGGACALLFWALGLNKLVEGDADDE